MKIRKPIGPCRNCEKRSAECHSACRKYKSFRKELDEYNAINRCTTSIADGWVRGSTTMRVYRKGKGNG